MSDKWTPPEGHPITPERAKALMTGDLGKVHRGILRGCCAPIYWHRPTEGNNQILNSGTLTFVRTPKRLMGVTAAHVVRGYERCVSCSLSPVQLKVLDASFGLEVIAISDELDLATLDVDEKFIGVIGKPIVPLSVWPPQLPTEGRGIMFAGYPGADRLRVNPNLWNWGLITVQDIARRVGNGQITWAASRDQDVQTDLPLNHNMGGISGGPLIGLFESVSYLSYYVLSGIIIEADKTLENVVARRADYIADDGFIFPPR